jgi:hypothetical protein
MSKILNRRHDVQNPEPGAISITLNQGETMKRKIITAICIVMTAGFLIVAAGCGGSSSGSGSSSSSSAGISGSAN